MVWVFRSVVVVASGNCSSEALAGKSTNNSLSLSLFLGTFVSVPVHQRVALFMHNVSIKTASKWL